MANSGSHRRCGSALLQIESPLSAPPPAAHSPTRAERLFWLTILVAHTLAAVAWWWLEPGGFPWGHPRFWGNRVLPMLGLTWCLVCLVGLHRGQDAKLLRWLPAFPSAWASGAVTGRFLFPITFARFWLVPLVVAVLMAVSLVPLWWRTVSRRRRSIAIVAGTWACIGAGVLLSQRPQSPGTHPLEIVLAESEPGSRQPSRTGLGVLHLSPGAAIYASEGSITARLSSLTLDVHPLLRFLSCSPDGCWVVLNRPDDRAGPEPRLRGVREPGQGTRFFDYEFSGLGPAVLRVAQESDSKEISIDAATTLKRPVFSHLNSFCDLEVRGHRRLFLGFSPCPEARIEVLPFDYPVGRPARFAYVDECRRFVVVEASSGEKGPFRTLAEGRLEPSRPLTITLYDEGRTAGRVTLEDWSAQLSTQLSPTAGWNVPVNAIEFSLAGTSPSSPASIFFTLAGTSVGRGWDCVGHAAGAYRNRMRIEQ
jgi:hypothetical protein